MLAKPRLSIVSAAYLQPRRMQLPSSPKEKPAEAARAGRDCRNFVKRLSLH